MRSQPELPLGAMSESMGMQQQGSMFMAHITTREHGAVSGQDSHRGPCGCPGAVHNWLHFSLDVTLGRAGISHLRPAPRSSNTMELTLVVGVREPQVHPQTLSPKTQVSQT